MKKLSVLAIALAATCMFSGCGKETKQNVQPAEETYKNTESETSEECAAAQEEFSEEVVDTEESIDDEWTDEASELERKSLLFWQMWIQITTVFIGVRLILFLRICRE